MFPLWRLAPENAVSTHELAHHVLDDGVAWEVFGVGKLRRDFWIRDDDHGRKDRVPVQIEDTGELEALLDGEDDSVRVGLRG